MNKSKILIIIIVLLTIIIGGVSFFAFRQVKENKEMTELFAIEKEEMENEYNTFATQYDELQVQINNDSLRQKLENEKLRTQRLLEELRQVKSSNAAEITRLKKELKTVRAVLRSYVVQIDSLNRLNEALTTENKEVKKPGFFSRAVNFCKALPKRISGAFKNMVAELKKVAWPSKKDLINYSLVVIGFVFALAIIVGVLDTASSFLVKQLIAL